MDKKLKINKEKLYQTEEIKFTNFENLLYYSQGLLYILKTHNKNYTKEQERLINTIYNICDCIEINKE